MAFDKDYFTQVNVGAKQGQRLWMYYTEDDVATTLNLGESTAYFDLYDYFPQAASGDIILVFNASSAAAHVTIFAITVNTSNGTSAMVCLGNIE